MKSMAKGARSRQTPPLADAWRRDAAVMLGRCLRKLRQTGNDWAVRDWAKELGIGASTLRKWESPPEDFKITLKDLERFQDRLGIPVAVIVAIAQMAAAVRDGKGDRLEAIAVMLDALADRVLNPGKRVELIGYSKQDDAARDADGAWDNLLADMIMVVWSRCEGKRGAQYRNEKRLAAYRADLEASRSKKTRPRPNLGIGVRNSITDSK